MSIKIYFHPTCLSSQKALQFLDSHRITYEAVSLREQVPRRAELRRVLSEKHGGRKRFLNTSSKEYKRFKLKDKVGGMSDDEFLGLILEHPGLLRRPLALSDEHCLIGFVREVWETKLLD